jgi:hypothetical protein
MTFGRMAPTVAGLQEVPDCKTSGVADSALKANNGKPCTLATTNVENASSLSLASQFFKSFGRRCL